MPFGLALGRFYIGTVCQGCRPMPSQAGILVYPCRSCPPERPAFFMTPPTMGKCGLRHPSSDDTVDKRLAVPRFAITGVFRTVDIYGHVWSWHPSLSGISPLVFQVARFRTRALCDASQQWDSPRSCIYGIRSVLCEPANRSTVIVAKVNSTVDSKLLANTSHACPVVHCSVKEELVFRWEDDIFEPCKIQTS